MSKTFSKMTHAEAFALGAKLERERLVTKADELCECDVDNRCAGHVFISEVASGAYDGKEFARLAWRWRDNVNQGWKRKAGSLEWRVIYDKGQELFAQLEALTGLNRNSLLTVLAVFK